MVNSNDDKDKIEDKKPINPEEKSVNADAILKEFDKESNTRIFTGFANTFIKVLLIGFSLFALWMNIFSLLPEQIRRTVFIGIVMMLAFIMYPIKPKLTKKANYIPWYDLLLSLASGFCYFYFAFNFEEIVNRAGDNTPLDIIVGGVGILLLLEVCRRVVGIPIIVVVSCFIAYAFFSGFSYTRIIAHLFYTTEGVIGTPLGVCSTFIVLFILFGAFLEKTGVGKFFIDISNSIIGFAAGGPAKVAVISSALQGMISGSSVANTVGSGSFTIPMMKKTGYKPEFAAAVEAAASTGGQIMPPIMGAAAFLMAEITGIPYKNIVIAAILPALLYFLGVFLMVHFEAKKLGLKGMNKEDIPKFVPLFLQRGYLLLPLFILVYTMMEGFTPSRAATLAILVAIIVSLPRADTRITPTSFCAALENGARSTLGVAVACAVAGMIVGVVTLTGIGLKLASGLLTLSGGVPLIALFFTMIACIVLGMGVPTTANYVIMATICAPIVVKLGIPLLAAHFFVFYFGIVADITPPVALAAYAGSAIAGSDPMKTGITATRLAITAFIIPYIMALSPAMLLINTNPFEVTVIILTSITGMIGVSTAMEGYMISKLQRWQRALCLIGGLTLIIPGLITDMIGISCIGLVAFLQYKENK